MTLPVFLADDLLVPSAAALRPGDAARLEGAEGRHAALARRLAVGELLDVVDGAGLRLTCEATAVSSAGAELLVRARREEPEPRPALVLVQALAKGGRDEQAVETATEIGVDRVVPWQANRSVVRWQGAKAQRGRAKWQALVRAASKQSRRARIPEVLPVLDSRGLAAWVRGFADEGGRCLVCHEEAVRALTAHLEELGADLGRAAGIAMIVGPEGGVDAAELEALRAAGAVPVLLGPHVLRSASAGPAAAVLVSAATGRWSRARENGA
jgi:16S rRNA (uracil1498-N3)-methyltransferase